MQGYGFMIDFFLGLVEPLFPFIFDPLFTPLLSISSPYTGALVTIAIISIGLSAILMLLRWWLMDLERHEELKEKRQEISDKMKEARNEGETEKANEHMQEMMSMQAEFFNIMLKPMLVSMVVFFVFLPWMYVTFIPVAPIAPMDGGFEGTLQYNGVSEPFTVENRTGEEPVIIIDGNEYVEGDSFKTDDLPWKVKGIDLGENPSVKFAAEIVQLPVSLPFVGDELGWLGTYILFVFPFSFIFGKLLGVQ